LKKKILIAFLFSSICCLANAQILLPENKISLPTAISETSGIEWINDSIWVTHNDSGNDPILYFLNKKGELKNSIKLNKTINWDWEDISFDGNEFIYISDLGNNLNTRTNLMIHRFSLKDSSEKTMKINYSDQKFPMQETNRNFDSEAMIFLNDHLYTFTKANSTPYNGICKMYKMNVNDSVQTVNPIDSMLLGDEGYWKNSVTAADLSDDKKKLALLTYKYLYLFYDFMGDDFLGGKYMRFLLPEIQQREAVVFDSSENIWMTDENSRLKNGGFLYFYDMQKINKGDFFYRESEIGIVSCKKVDKKRNSISKSSEFKIKADISTEGNYTISYYENGELTNSIESTFKKKIETPHIITIKENCIYSFRIYKDNKLLYANKISME